jgi:dTDP-4-dehydrorhamnose reductase
MERIRPWAVVNAAGYESVDAAETEPYLCYRANTQGPVQLAAACAARDIRLLTFSSAMVFDGAKGTPYLESDPVCPLCVYGRSKAEAEARVRQLLSSALIIRTGGFFGPWDEDNFVTRGLRALAAGLPFVEAGDSGITPAYLPDVVHTSLDLLIDGESGIWHLANPDAVTPAELVRRAAQVAGLEASGVEEWPLHDMRLTARRPAHNILSSERGILLPSLQDALVRYVQKARVQWQEKGLEAVLSHLVKNRSEPQHFAVARAVSQSVSR